MLLPLLKEKKKVSCSGLGFSNQGPYLCFGHILKLCLHSNLIKLYG